MKEPDADSFIGEALLDDQPPTMLHQHWRRVALGKRHQILIESSLKRIAESRELLSRVDKILTK